MPDLLSLRGGRPGISEREPLALEIQSGFGATELDFVDHEFAAVAFGFNDRLTVLLLGSLHRSSSLKALARGFVDERYLRSFKADLVGPLSTSIGPRTAGESKVTSKLFEPANDKPAIARNRSIVFFIHTGMFAAPEKLPIVR